MTIGSVHPIGRIQPTSSSSVGGSQEGGFVSIAKLPYDDVTYVKNDVETSSQLDAGVRLYRESLIRLFSMVLHFGIDIVALPDYTPVLSSDPNEKVTTEASFQAPPVNSMGVRPKISLQLSRKHGPYELKASADDGSVDPFLQNRVEDFVDNILSYFNDSQVSRLIIVTVHELGHYLSYKEGNHRNKHLRLASQLFNKKQLAQMTSEHKKLIWLEECLAWAYGAQVLSQIGFDNIAEYDQVKVESLKAYFKVLKLKELNLDTYLQLLSQPDYKQVIDLISPLLFQESSTTSSSRASLSQENHDIYGELSRGKRIVPV